MNEHEQEKGIVAFVGTSDQEASRLSETSEPSGDDVLLQSLEARLQLIRDRVRGVAERFTTGLFVHGQGGTSKTFTVTETLRKLGRSFRVTNTKVTARGLLDLLRESQDDVHLIEDAEQILSDKAAAGILRSALWGQANKDGYQERVIVWQKNKERIEVRFTGGLVILSNRNLPDLPELKAVRTRVPCLEFSPTNDELAAFMRKLAKNGHRHGPHFLPPESCSEVADAVLEMARKFTRPLDIRLYVNSCNDRIQFEAGCSQSHWLTLLESSIDGRVVSEPESRKGREDELAIAKELASLPPTEMVRAWVERTGRSRATLYRLLKSSRLNEKNESAVS